MERAWTFYRRSTDKQELSIEDQRRECRAFAAAQGWTIVREFQPPKGFASGQTIDRDPVFKEMLTLADRPGHGIRRLVVYDVSRFGRLPPKRKIYYQEHLAMRGIQVVYVKDGFRDDGSIGDDITQMVKHSEAHQYSLKLSEVTLRGSKSHAALGHSTGGKAPYGYDRMLVDAQGKSVGILKRGERKATKDLHVIWTPSPTQAPIIRMIFQKATQGLGLLRLVQYLNAQRIAPPVAALWGKSIVRHILRNRAYVGDRIYNRTNCKARRRGESAPFIKQGSEWIIKPGAHKPLISQELFDRVQARQRVHRFGVGRTYGRPYLLTGLGRCHCGSNLVGSWRRDRHENKVRGYICGAYSRMGKSGCRYFFIPASEVEDLALAAIRSQFQMPGWKKQCRTVMERIIGEGTHEIGITALRRQQKDVYRQIENLTVAIAAHGYSLAMGESLKTLELQRETLQASILDVEARGRHPRQENVVDRVLAMAGEFEERFEECVTTDEKKGLLKQFIYGMNIDLPADAPPVATYHVYRFPGMQTALDDSIKSRMVKEVAGAGLVHDPKWPPISILPWITTRNYNLKTASLGQGWRRV